MKCQGGFDGSAYLSVAQRLANDRKLAALVEVKDSQGEREKDQDEKQTTKHFYHPLDLVPIIDQRTHWSPIVDTAYNSPVRKEKSYSPMQLGTVVFLLGLLVLPCPTALSQEPQETPSSYYHRGMELWRQGQTGEALRHLMTATRDPETSFYAARQVALMGEYALPNLYRGLWHDEEVIQRMSAVIIGWIGDEESVEPLLLRMRFPDAPLETEYALRKIGSITGEQILSLVGRQDLSNAKLLDRKISSVSRLSDSLRLPIDPVPLVSLAEEIEQTQARELEEDPFGHMASARLNLLRFLAGRGVSKSAPLLVQAFHPEAEEADVAITRALIGLGDVAVEPLESAFRESDNEVLRPYLAVAHYFASGAPELSASRPMSVVMNDVSSGQAVGIKVATLAALFSETPNPLLAWFEHHPSAEVRLALAPAIPAEQIRRRVELKTFYLDKTRDTDTTVAATYLLFVGNFLPDSDVEARLASVLESRDELAVMREAALETVARHGPARLLRNVLTNPSDPLRTKAVEWAAGRTEPEIITAVLAILREADRSEAKRAAIELAAVEWGRSEAVVPLAEIVRTGDSLWKDAARGLAALGSDEAVDSFVALIDSGRTIDPDEAGALYFAFTGVASRLTGTGPGSYQFLPLGLDQRPAGDKVLVILREKSDYQGWVKAEEQWKGRRLFRLDEGQGELILYDQDAYDRVVSGAGIVLLEDSVRQTVLSPLELSELREQKVKVIDELPERPFAGLDGNTLHLLYQGQWTDVALGRDLRDEDGRSGWGRSALVPLRLFDRDKIRFSPDPPPSGWLKDEAQPELPEKP
jgi:hypothetical protein